MDAEEEKQNKENSLATVANKRRTLLLAVIGVMLVAVGISGYLTWLFEQVANDPGASAFCNISAKVDCTSVISSTYGHIWGISISTFGGIFYAMMAIVALVALNPGENQIRKHLPVYIMINGVLVSVYSFYLLFIMQTELDTFCFMCGILYLCNFALFLLGFLLVRNEGFPVIGTFREDFKYLLEHPALLIAMLAADVILIALLGYRYHTYTSATQNAVINIFTQEKIELEPDGTPIVPNGTESIKIDLSKYPMKGNPNANIQIIEIADYRCPACKRSHDYIKEIEKEHGDEFNLIFSNFPLDIECNKILRKQIHRFACEAAYAAACAGEQGKFWEYNDKLFDEQRRWVKEDFRTYAKGMFLDMQSFEACMLAPRTKKRIQDDIELGRKLGVSSTPTLFVNGYRVSGLIDVEQFEKIKEQFDSR